MNDLSGSNWLYFLFWMVFVSGTLGGFSVNPNLPQLVSELAKFCTDGVLDAFGMYLYGVVLKALHRQSCQTAKISNSVLGETRTQHYKEALNAFIDSILMFPNNWSGQVRNNLFRVHRRNYRHT